MLVQAWWGHPNMKVRFVDLIPSLEVIIEKKSDETIFDRKSMTH